MDEFITVRIYSRNKTPAVTFYRRKERYSSFIRWMKTYAPSTSSKKRLNAVLKTMNFSELVLLPSGTVASRFTLFRY